MTDVSIVAEGLAKQYRIGARRSGADLGWGYRTLRDAVSDAVSRPFRRTRRWPQGNAESGDPGTTIWALRGVSFQIGQGEIVGIIGRNGAGKSTLLKILSRITEPTKGYVELRGRVGSLLEVGTGFHPELTGRENLYLNGAILGMRRIEIQRKFDEIVAFAGIDRFIDTAVKHYSSGMYTRLAFAIAAHLEPEILLVDEVLSVGDAQFQRKCLDKMEDVSRGGRTVLFVSHNMQAVVRLCPRSILIEDGLVLKDGPTDEVVGAYLSAGLGTSAAREWRDLPSAPQGEVARLVAVRVLDDQGQVAQAVDIRRPVVFEVEYDVLRGGHPLRTHFELRNHRGVEAFSGHDLDPAWRHRPRPAGRYRTRVTVPGNLLAEGTMFLTIGLTALEPRNHQFYLRDIVAFQVMDTIDGDSARGDFGGHMGGVVRPKLSWDNAYEPGGTAQEGQAVDQ